MKVKDPELQYAVATVDIEGVITIISTHNSIDDAKYIFSGILKGYGLIIPHVKMINHEKEED